MPRPMMWPSFGTAPPLLLPPPGLLLDPMLVSSASGSTCASTSVSASGSMIALSRTVSSHGHSMSAQCVSNVVTLPAMALPPLQQPLQQPLPCVPAAAMHSPTLLTVASMCQSSVECSAPPWTPLHHPGLAEIEPDVKQMIHPPTCISDGESTVITQVADPSKQCSAGVQTQTECENVTSEFLSTSHQNPSIEEKKESSFTEDSFSQNETEKLNARGFAQIKTNDLSSSSGPLFYKHEECQNASIEKSTAPLVVEADSNGEQECVASPEPHISSSYQESEELTNVPEKPNELDVSGLELLYKSIEHMESLEVKKSVTQDSGIDIEESPEVPKPKLDGLGLLCALAEQRIQEELNNESERFKSQFDSPSPNKPLADVNRNYRTPKSEQEVRRFLATRTETPHTSVSPVTFKLPPQNDSLEMEMRNRLAELQRMYKETQRELSRLTPRKSSNEGESSSGSHNGNTPLKKTSSKSAQFRKKKTPAKKRPLLKPDTLNDPPPPVLERVTDDVEVSIPKVKWSRLDAPPTLIPHKPPTEVTPCNPPSFKLNLVKLPATKDHKRRWSVDSPSTRVSTETQHADDEDSDGLWSDFISKPSDTLNSNRKHKSTNEVSSIHSTSKRRKVGKPKRHFDKEGNGHHATETIVPKQPRSKASLVSYLLASKTAGQGKAQNEKTLKECPTSRSPTHSPEHRPKIRPKLKAEVKVKESWEDEDLMDWPTPKPQLPSHPLRPLDLEFECMEELSNSQDRDLGLKRHEDNEDDEWLPSSKKIKSPIVQAKSALTATFAQQHQQQKHSVEKVPPPAKPKKPTNLARERRQSTEKLHLKKPVCSTVEERMPLKVSNDPTSCVLTAELLETADFPARTLTAQGGLFYAGLLNAVMPPDVYSIVLHGERASRPNIYSREEILQDTILEVRPPSVESLSIGTRLCAYWSQQTKCLYPGVVVPPLTPDPSLDGDFVTVEFDDGDSGQIRIQDIRLLPSNYPVVEIDPNPLLSLTKRRRRNSEKSVDSKDRRVSADSAISSNASFSETNKLEEKKETTVAESILDQTDNTKSSAPSAFPTSSPICLVSSKISENKSKRELKKQRREKLKRLMTASAAASSADTRKRKHKHKHKRKHRHRHSSGSSSDAALKTDLEHSFSDCIIKSEISKELISSHQSMKEEIPSYGYDATTGSDWKVKENEIKHHNAEDNEKVFKAQQEFDEGWETGTELDHKIDQIESVSPHPDLELAKKPKRKQDRQNSTEFSKIAAFLPPRKLWSWSGKGYKRQGGKGRKKEFYKCIQRDEEEIKVGDCAVFLSTNSPDRPYIGRIESLWETYNGMMVVRVKWFYHPEETEGCPSLKYSGGLFQSDHADDNDVQTISHRCEVLPLSEYEKKANQNATRTIHLHDVYYLAGSYDPKNIQIKLEKGVV